MYVKIRKVFFHFITHLQSWRNKPKYFAELAVTHCFNHAFLLFNQKHMK